jgi:CRP-like cAMP-binding protein
LTVTAVEQAAKQNRVLAALPQEIRAKALRGAEVVELGSGDDLYPSGAPFRHVYFPTAGVVSVVVEMKSGTSAEVGTIGLEGFVGIGAFLGAERSSAHVFCQVPGETIRLPTEPFVTIAQHEPVLRRRLNRYTQAFLDQSSQSTACAHLHGVEQRLGRWLLMTHDRVGSPEFPLTQAFLAQMLGVRRATVNGIASLLQRSGLIMYVRGRITVLSRSGLEATSCECYETVKRRYAELMD